MPISDEEIRARIESALYAYGRPLEIAELAKAARITSKRKTIKIVRDILKSFNENMVALEISELPGHKFVMQLKPKYSKIAKIAGRSNLIIAILIVIFAVFIRTGGV